MSLSASIKSIQDIMRKDVGVDGDDIYRNLSGEPRASRSLFDTVLGVGGDRP